MLGLFVSHVSSHNCRMKIISSFSAAAVLPTYMSERYYVGNRRRSLNGTEFGDLLK